MENVTRQRERALHKDHRPSRHSDEQELTPVTFGQQTPLMQLCHSLVRVPSTGRWSTPGANPTPFFNYCQDSSTLDLVYWDTALK